MDSIYAQRRRRHHARRRSDTTFLWVAAMVVFVIALLAGGAVLVLNRSDRAPLPMAAGRMTDPSYPDRPLQAAQFGALVVSVTDITVDSARVRDLLGTAFRTDKSYLLVDLRLHNTSPVKKIDYHTWGGEWLSFRTGAWVSDEHGNTYRRIVFIWADRERGKKSEVIYPEDQLTDALVFERPVSRAEQLTLHLPGENVGEPATTGKIALQYPH